MDELPQLKAICVALGVGAQCDVARLLTANYTNNSIIDQIVEGFWERV